MKSLARRTLLYAAIAVSLLVLAEQPALAGPCGVDAKNFCKGVPATPEAVNKCLEANKHQLSPACKANRREEAKIMVLQACKSDTQSICPLPNEANRLQCLQDNEAKLTPMCKDKVRILKGYTAAQAPVAEGDPCTKTAAEWEKKCFNENAKGNCYFKISQGLPPYLKCLRNHKDKISPRCRQAICPQ